MGTMGMAYLGEKLLGFLFSDLVFIDVLQEVFLFEGLESFSEFSRKKVAIKRKIDEWVRKDGYE